jgi:hypothetical protein
MAKLEHLNTHIIPDGSWNPKKASGASRPSVTDGDNLRLVNVKKHLRGIL